MLDIPGFAGVFSQTEFYVQILTSPRGRCVVNSISFTSISFTSISFTKRLAADVLMFENP
jgi:hypothetical protein